MMIHIKFNIFLIKIIEKINIRKHKKRYIQINNKIILLTIINLHNTNLSNKNLNLNIIFLCPRKLLISNINKNRKNKNSKIYL